MSAPRDSRYDAIIVGAGHNGLVAATLLAQLEISVEMRRRRVSSYTPHDDGALPAGHFFRRAARY